MSPVTKSKAVSQIAKPNIEQLDIQLDGNSVTLDVLHLVKNDAMYAWHDIDLSPGRSFPQTIRIKSDGSASVLSFPGMDPLTVFSLVKNTALGIFLTGYTAYTSTQVIKAYVDSNGTLTKLPDTCGTSTCDDNPDLLATSQTRLAYIGTNSKGVRKLYLSDGVKILWTSNTRADVNLSDDVTSAAYIGNDLYFSAKNSAGQQKLFRYNGSSTSQSCDIHVGGHDVDSTISSLGTKVVYIGFNADNGKKLYAASGNTCSQISNFSNDTSSDTLLDLTINGAFAYVRALNPDTRQYFVWKTDGTTLTQIPTDNETRFLYKTGDLVVRQDNSNNFSFLEGNSFTLLPDKLHAETIVSYRGDYYFTGWSDSQPHVKLYKFADHTAKQILDLNGKDTDDFYSNELVTFNNSIYFETLEPLTGKARFSRLWY